MFKKRTNISSTIKNKQNVLRLYWNIMPNCETADASLKNNVSSIYFTNGKIYWHGTHYRVLYISFLFFVLIFVNNISHFQYMRKEGKLDILRRFIITF